MQTIILPLLVLLLSIYIKFFIEILNFVTIMHFSNRSLGSSSHNCLVLITQVHNNFVRFFLNFCIFSGTFSKLIHILNIQSCDNSFHHLKIWCNVLVFFLKHAYINICCLSSKWVAQDFLDFLDFFLVITSNTQFKVLCMFWKPCAYEFIHFWTSLATQNCQKKSLHTPYNQNLHHGAKILVGCVVQQVPTWCNMVFCRYLMIYRNDKLVICAHSRFCISVFSKNYYLYLATFKHLKHLQSTIKFDNLTLFTCFQYMGTNSYFIILPLEDLKQLSWSKNSKHLWIE